MSLLHISAILLLELAAFLGPWLFVAIIASLLWRALDRRVTRETNAFLEEQRNLRAYKALHERFLK